MKLLELYAKAKKLFPFTEASAPSIKFLSRRSSIDEVEYKYESVVSISKSRNKRIVDEEVEDIKKKVKKTKKLEI